MATKHKTTKKPAKRTPTQKTKQAQGQMYAILLFALGIFFFCLAIVEGGGAWRTVHIFMLGCFSWCAFFVGPIIIYTAIMVANDQNHYSIVAKLTCCCLLLLLFSAALHIFRNHPPQGSLWEVTKSLYTDGTHFIGGGATALIIGVPLLAWLEFAGASITVILLIFVAVMILSGSTLLGLYRRAIVNPVKKIEEVYASAVESHSESVPQPVAPRFNIDVDLDAPVASKEKEGKKSPQSRKSRREQTTVATAQEKLLSSIQNTNNPLITSQNPKESSKIFDYDKAAPPATSTSAVPQTPDLDAIITRVVTGESNISPHLPESLHFGEANSISSPPQKSSAESEASAPASTKSDIPQAPYTFPSLDLLDLGKQLPSGDTTKELKANADRLVNTLKSFGVQTRIVDISRGPAVTRYELQPSVGVKISRITGLADDIALNLAAAGVRIEAPIPNKAAIGIEVPNKVVSAVTIRELLDSRAFRTSTSNLTVAMGRDISGNITLADIAKMPHVLIAGATGSGKSVCINSIIISLLYKADPDAVKLLMIDPKVVELGVYNGIPHLLSPVVTDPKKAAGALCTMVGEMLRRYKLFADTGVRDLSGYNQLAENDSQLEKLPQIVIIIDELADLMMAAPKDVEDYICRLAQMARAAGMHLVIATQRPSVDVITGVIKANIPSRISFAVSSQVDSRTILDVGGAEKLLGRGDMLFAPSGSSKATRVQGCFVTDAEVERVVNFIKEGSTAQYDQQLMDEIERNATTQKIKGTNSASDDDGDSDSLIHAAIDTVVESGQASTSLLQRRLKIGYARAARLVDEMEQRGVVGPFEGSKPRQVLLSRERWQEMKLNNDR